MKITTVVLIAVFILLLFYYTSETYDVVKIVGKHTYDFFDGVIGEVSEHEEQGTYKSFREDLQEKYNSVLKN